MLKWALIFGFICIVAGVFGFGGIAGATTQAAQILFTAALAAFLLCLFLGMYVIEGAE